jgi:hypothetical protein
LTTTRHILGLSGGKDSAALAIYMSQNYPTIEMEYFFTDTGHELPEVYKFLDKLESKLQISISRLKPEISEHMQKLNEVHGDDSEKQMTPFKYLHRQNNYFLPSNNARWCTLNMKLFPLEKWVSPTLEKGGKIISYVAIRADENREGYKSTNNAFTVKFPFAEDGIDKQGVINLLDKSGIGLPEYYKWRSRSGCTFCFYQQKIEWVKLKEIHPDKFEEAKGYEKLAIDHESPFTWSAGESLLDLEKPKRMEQIKKDFAKRQERWEKTKRSRDPLSWAKEDRHYNAMEDVDDIYGEKLGHSCIMCHK